MGPTSPEGDSGRSGDVPAMAVLGYLEKTS